MRPVAELAACARLHSAARRACARMPAGLVTSFVTSQKKVEIIYTSCDNIIVAVALGSSLKQTPAEARVWTVSAVRRGNMTPGTCPPYQRFRVMRVTARRVARLRQHGRVVARQARQRRQRVCAHSLAGAARRGRQQRARKRRRRKASRPRGRLRGDVADRVADVPLRSPARAPQGPPRGRSTSRRQRTQPRGTPALRRG